ncbi:DUF3892 domain-containing protein [Desulfobotulus sp. H1]|uniref:DUF3892 domain-containing protein n=1 Tax=Desulfobotulus pelophilus TaxID=2823377 RepID=A0ABT3NDB7_9BACT|nr:DUF3892 domain-containing protein [Desulfobotulus pelophilus]MCW7755415.1 DUF3892 domain-containing protein [Desulfobotulus pelophilus]
MAKWADYGISAVRYDSDDQYIDKVKVHKDNGDTIGAGETWTRTDVLSKMDDDKTFITILKDSNDKWKKGQDIHIITVNGRRFLRTDANERAKDNLENLPK